MHITGFSAEACNIKRLHNDGFHADAVEDFDIERDVLAHYMDTATKVNLYKKLNDACT